MADRAYPLAIVGAGSLGQCFAALLAASGQPTVLFGTPGSVVRLRAAGALRLHGVVDLEVPVCAGAPGPGQVQATDDPAALPAGAGLIFCTKGQHVRDAMEAIRPAWPAPDDADAWVCGVQNGLAKDDILAEGFGAERVVGAVSIFAGQREPDGRVAATARGATYLGEFGGRPSERVTRAAATLDAAGIPTQAVDTIESVLWSKACNAVGVFGVSVPARASVPRLFHDPALIRAYLTLIRETAALGAACGVRVADYVNFPIRTYVEQPDEVTIAEMCARPLPAPGAPISYPSMTQDLLAGRSLEVEEVFGDMVRRAERIGFDAPRITLVTELIRAVDPGRPAPAP